MSGVVEAENDEDVVNEDVDSKMLRALMCVIEVGMDSDFGGNSHKRERRVQDVLGEADVLDEGCR